MAEVVNATDHKTQGESEGPFFCLIFADKTIGQGVHVSIVTPLIRIEILGCS